MNEGAQARRSTDARAIKMPALIKELAFVALIVAALTVTLVGFHIEDVPGGVALKTRLWDVVVAALIAVAGRLALILLRIHRPAPVFAVTAPLAGLMLVGLLSESFFGAEAANILKPILPFQSVVIQWVLMIVVIGFAVRAFQRMRHASSDVTVEERERRMDRFSAQVQEATRFIGPVLILVALTLPFWPWTNRWFLDIAILVMTYVMLGWGLNIVVGLAGLLDLGYVAFYAVGAYSYGLLATEAGMSFWISLPFAGLMAATAGVILGFPVLRLRGDYLAIVTLGFGEMVRVTLQNWYSLTKGPDGISGIPPASFFGLSFKGFYKEVPGSEDDVRTTPFHEFFGWDYDPLDKITFLYYLILAMALITNLFTLRVRKLPVGRAWEALREDEIACRSLGINPTNTKLTAFGIGAMFGGFAGSFFATRQGFISPESFVFLESAVILAIVVLGGFGSQVGVVVAAFVLIGMPELFRDLQQYRMLAFGASMVLIMLWRPAGLLAHREPTIRLSPKLKGGLFSSRKSREAPGVAE